MRFRLSLCLLLAAGPPLAFGATPVLVRDIDQRSNASHIFIEQIVSVGERAVFFLRSDGFGEAPRLQELWTTDGTASGTERLRSFPGLVSLGGNGRVAFFATIPGGFTDTWQLWRTDGTAAGTFSVSPTLGPPRPRPQASSTLYQDRLVFNGCTLQGGCELWASDGTTAGTRQVRDITPGPAGSGPHGFAVAGGTLYFLVDDPTGPALWASDGTSAGTQQVATLPPFSQAHDLTAAGDRIFFLDGEPNSPQTLLWTSDGSAAGTRTVPPFDHARSKGPAIASLLGGLGDSFFFTTVDRPTGQQLWRTDGTPRGTLRLTSFVPRRGGFFSSQGAALEDRFVFPGPGGHLWTTTGTRASTQRLAGCPGGCPLASLGAGPLVHDGKLFFTGITQSTGEGLWVTDGTGAGTHRLGGSSPLSFSVLLGRVFFVARTGLWTTDGTPGGTVLLSGGFAGFLAATGSRAVFVNFSNDSNPRLGVTDGTAAGTAALDIHFSQDASSNPSYLLPFGSDVRFLTCGDDDSPQTWTSDGTAGGTFPLSDPTNDCAPLAKLGNALFFQVFDFDLPFDNAEIWRSDGAQGVAFPITAFGPDGMAVNLGTTSDRLVIFVQNLDSEGFELWKSDGTLAGTAKVIDLPDSDPQFLAAVPGGVPGEFLFQAMDEDGFTSLWRSDGTADGTFRRLDFFSPETTFTGFTRFNDALYFAAGEDGLWKTDGTPAGTRQILQDAVTELVPFAGSLFLSSRSLLRSDGSEAGTHRIMDLGVSQLTVAGGVLYFVAFDADHGTELWRSDGTRAGSRIVADVSPGTGSSFPAQLTAAGGLLYFTANDGEHGRELWVTDGTGPGTRMVGDIAAGPPSSSPVQLTVAGDHLFFSADDGFTGRELWLLPLGADNP